MSDERTKKLDIISSFYIWSVCSYSIYLWLNWFSQAIYKNGCLNLVLGHSLMWRKNDIAYRDRCSCCVGIYRNIVFSVISNVLMFWNSQISFNWLNIVSCSNIDWLWKVFNLCLYYHYCWVFLCLPSIWIHSSDWILYFKYC